MKSISGVRGAAVCASACLILLFSGCGGPQMQQADANRPWDPAQRPTSIDETQLTPLLTKVSQLQMASQESLEAAKLIGTPEHELTEAQQAYMSGEQCLQDGLSNMYRVGIHWKLRMRLFGEPKKRPCAPVSRSLNESSWRIMGVS